jgi:hypothetical protein
MDLVNDNQIVAGLDLPNIICTALANHPIKSFCGYASSRVQNTAD